MKKGNKVKTEQPVVEITPTVETVVETSQPQVADVEVKKQLGRPPVPGSKRQIAMAERAAKLANGTLKRGRKSNPNSKRQARLAHRAELIASGVLTGKKGRPTNSNSKHQKALAEKQARINANGGVALKPGRPKMTEEQKAAAAAAKITPGIENVVS